MDTVQFAGKPRFHLMIVIFR